MLAETTLSFKGKSGHNGHTTLERLLETKAASNWADLPGGEFGHNKAQVNSQVVFTRTEEGDSEGQCDLVLPKV